MKWSGVCWAWEGDAAGGGMMLALHFGAVAGKAGSGRVSPALYITSTTSSILPEGGLSLRQLLTVTEESPCG